MTIDRTTTSAASHRFQHFRGAVLAAAVAALLGVPMLAAEARAASSPTADAQLEPVNWFGANRKAKQTRSATSRDANAGRRSCWEYRRHQGRLKRVNVCFSGDR